MKKIYFLSILKSSPCPNTRTFPTPVHLKHRLQTTYLNRKRAAPAVPPSTDSNEIILDFVWLSTEYAGIKSAFSFS